MKCFPLWRALLLVMCVICHAGRAVDTDQTCTDEDSCLKQGSSSDLSKKETLVRDLIEWILKHGGFVNDEQEVRPVDPSDPLSELGVFATDTILEDGLLLSIPWHLTIHPEGDNEGGATDFSCETTRALLKEIGMRHDSYFAPFLKHLLFSQNDSPIPESFSDVGQELLNDILGLNLGPQGYGQYWLEDMWRNACGGGSGPVEEIAAMIVLKNSDDALLVPFYDLYRHRNGAFQNTRNKITLGAKFEVFATRKIKAGEQIHTSFNLCATCHQQTTGYGSPELFRDHGLIEQMPQRWEFGGLVIELREDESGNLNVTQLPVSTIEPSDEYHEVVIAEIERINSIAEEWGEEDIERTSLIPVREWNNIWKFYDAMHLALSTLDDSLRSGNYERESSQDSDDDGAYIHEDDKLYNQNFEACYDEKHYLNLTGFDKLDNVIELKSHYQEMSFYEKPDTMDKCFDLEETVQICNSYRPHYHEPFVHFPAAFLKDLRRVIFVGGGDSMLLHEVLKYPSIELVVALELDQKVVRTSFKHFFTQPYFNDKRVQWWFGDATKGMTMLPQEWYGSFDLVLVDLSETVMSMTVTEHLDMFEALALLVKPDGVFVKNEHYFDKLSEIFDYVTWLVLNDTPVICKQDFIMASNRIDFLHPNFELIKKNNIKNLLYNPLENAQDHFDLFWDYSKNDAVANGKCEPHDEALFDPDKQRRAGVLLVLEVDEVNVPLVPVVLVEETLHKALLNAGLTPVSTVSKPSTHGGSAVVVVMKEGYVVAHTWPKYNYCALDIQLWASFDKMESVKGSLLQSMGSSEDTASSFRLIAGGMRGTDTWKEDLAKIGPRNVNTRSCDTITIDDEVALPSTEMLLRENLSLLENKDTMVVVLCGDSAERSCTSLETLKHDNSFTNIVAIWSCPAGESVAPTVFEKVEGLSRNVVICGENTMNGLRKVVEENENIGLLIVDPSASDALIMGSELVWSHKVIGKELLSPNVLLMVLGLDDSRSRLLKRSRLMVHDVHVEVLNYTVSVGGEDKVKVGLMASNRTGFVSDVVDLTENISKHTGAKAFISEMKGDVRTDMTYVWPQSFSIDDYDRIPALQQFSEQRPLASQTIFQLGRTEGNEDEPIIFADLLDALRRSFGKNGLSQTEVSSDLGDGALLVTAKADGHVIVLWDGGTRVDLNILSYDEEEKHTDFASYFMAMLGDMQVMLVDEQPRGTGGVVNFLTDTGKRNPGCWDNYHLCLHYSKDGGCKRDEIWMNENCRKTCGVCGLEDEK
eukprot:scaffold27183_cov56-Attheya_sp.AAC.1